MRLIKNFITDLKEDKVHAFLLFFCLALFIWIGFFKTQQESVFSSDTNVVELYHTHGCPHCAQAIDFVNETLQKEFPAKQIEFLELSSISNAQRNVFLEFAEKNNIKGVPVLISGETYIEGFNQKAYRALMSGTLETNEKHATCAYTEGGDCDAPDEIGEITAEEIAKALGKEPPRPSRMVEIPFLGEIDVFQQSLPFLSIVLGLVDGFNPCAMWVLVFMISVIADLKDKRKTMVIVGSFVAASGVFYFVLMTGWINLFKIIGYIRLLTVGVGAIALYTGISSLRSFFEGHMTCKVTSAEGRNRIKQRITALAEKPLSWATLTGVFALAIIVNGIEFVCSAALPAIFTSVLAFSNISTFMHYFYILVYVLFFMLDDLIVFSLAAFAVNKYAGDKYMIWCKLLGGLVLVGLGFVMLFFPDWLA